MEAVSRKQPEDTAWPPLGVRALRPDLRVNASPDAQKFSTMRAALERVANRDAPVWSGLCPAGKHGLDFEGQDCDVCRHECGGQCERDCQQCWLERGGMYLR